MLQMGDVSKSDLVQYLLQMSFGGFLADCVQDIFG